MSFFSADEFLPVFGPSIRNESVQSWVWAPEDDQIGKQYSWDIGGDGVEAIATVDLQQSQLLLSISERNISDEGDPRQNDAVVTFLALIQFEDQSVSLDGQALPYTEQAMRDVIRQFNDRI